MTRTEAYRLISADQLSRQWDVPLSWIYRRTAKGHPDPLPAIRLGGLLRFDPEELTKWAERHRSERGA
jgi:hypothetical protein